jgi:hypothetical protein
MEERFFKITNDLDSFCHASYTHKHPLSSGALVFNDLGDQALTRTGRSLHSAASCQRTEHRGIIS